MSIRTLVAALALGAGWLGLAAPARAQTSDPTAAARAQIAAVQVRWDSIARAGDAAANADLFTEDALVGLGGLADLRGRPAILAAMKGFYERYFVQAEQHRTVELEAYGDTAYDRGTYLFVSGPRGGAAKTERGRYSAVWHRGADGVWRVHRYLENLLPADPAP